MGSKNQYFFKAPHVVPVCSQVWELGVTQVVSTESAFKPRQMGPESQLSKGANYSFGIWNCAVKLLHKCPPLRSQTFFLLNLPLTCFPHRGIKKWDFCFSLPLRESPPLTFISIFKLSCEHISLISLTPWRRPPGFFCLFSQRVHITVYSINSCRLMLAKW